VSESEQASRRRVEFFRLAIQYYAAGRFAAHSSLIPVAGNLLHHAVEMALKGGLAKSLPEAEIRAFRHGLSALWTRFVGLALEPPPPGLDDAINALDRFEGLRYPERWLGDGAEMTLSFRKDMAVTTEGGTMAPLPRYDLVLEGVDELMQFLFRASGVNPKFHTQSLREGAREALARDNLQPLEGNAG